MSSRSAATHPSRVAVLATAITLLSLTAWAHPSTAGAGPAATTWRTVVQESFGSDTVPSGWETYTGHFGGTADAYASPTHVFVRRGVLHLLGAYDDSGAYGHQWYTGGVCLCGTASLSSISARVSFRYRIVDAGAPAGIDYAFLRWPDSEHWPYDGEEDFAEGAADAAGTSFSTTLHHADQNGHDVNTPQFTVGLSAIGAWHTVRYTRLGNAVSETVNGQTKVTYTGTSSTLPATLKHVVFQQQCHDVCPSDIRGAVDVQIDDVRVEVPSA